MDFKPNAEILQCLNEITFSFGSYIGIFYLQKHLNWLQYSCIMLYSVVLYFSAKTPANAETCIRQRDFSAGTRPFYLAPKRLRRFYHQVCFQIDVPRMVIVSRNVTYKPAPSNTNFQCVSQLNATSGCGSGSGSGLREETVLKRVEMHSILSYNK